MIRDRLPHPLPLGLLMVAVLIAGMAIGMVLNGSLFSGTNAAPAAAGEAAVRIAATPREDGSVKLGLQQQGDDGAWGEVSYPDFSIVPAGAEPNRRLYSSALTVSTAADVYTLADSYYDWAILTSEALEAELPDPQVWCLLHDRADNEIGRAVCYGFVDQLGADSVEHIRYTELPAALGQVAARITGGERADLLVVGHYAELFGALTLNAQLGDELAILVGFPVKTVDPEPPAGDAYCLIGHGTDSFWRLTFEAATASAHHLGVDLQDAFLESAEERAAKIRECVAHGASAIAATLAETEYVSAALLEARAQGVPVVTYNSGSAAAKAAGSLLHLGLDDRQAGEIVGERLTASGLDGPALCLLHEAQNVGLTERCEGLDDAYGDVEVISIVDGYEAFSERLAVGDVGAVLLLNAADVRAVLEIIGQAGVSPSLAVIGFDTQLMRPMLSGAVSFAVWDHGITQGYLALALAALAENTFLVPDLALNGAQLLIQPSIFTAEDLRRLMAGN